MQDQYNQAYNTAIKDVIQFLLIEHDKRKERDNYYLVLANIIKERYNIN